MNGTLSRSFAEEATVARCTHALRQIPWSSLRSKRPNASSESDREAKVDSFVLGLNPMTGEEMWHQSHPDFRDATRNAYNALSDAMRNHDPSFVFHQITLNRNFKCRKHLDSKNAGPSYIIGFGDYHGGELVVWDGPSATRGDPSRSFGGGNLGGAGVAHNIRHRFVSFNGKTQFHETAAFVGFGGGEPERLTAVFYSAGPGGRWAYSRSGGVLSRPRLGPCSSDPGPPTGRPHPAAGALQAAPGMGVAVAAAAAGAAPGPPPPLTLPPPCAGVPLTVGQRAAVEADPCQPLAVLAGAGCGKTHTLVRNPLGKTHTLLRNRLGKTHTLVRNALGKTHTLVRNSSCVSQREGVEEGRSQADSPSYVLLPTHAWCGAPEPLLKVHPLCHRWWWPVVVVVVLVVAVVVVVAVLAAVVPTGRSRR